MTNDELMVIIDINCNLLVELEINLLLRRGVLFWVKSEILFDVFGS